jgi:hypothetical protein
VLGTSGVGSGGLASSVSAGMNGMVGKNGNGRAAEASAYPLVEATVEFLKEFVVDDDRSKEKGNANANINGRIASGSASGSRSSSTSRTSSSRGGKGKERERERGDSIHDTSGGVVGKREDDNGWTESFWPTYVYDAMQVKKRFEHMRVSFLLVSSTFRSPVVSPVVLPFLPFYFLFNFFPSYPNSCQFPLYRAATKTRKNSLGFISTHSKKSFWRCCWLFLLLLRLILQVQVDECWAGEERETWVCYWHHQRRQHGVTVGGVV